MVAENKSFGLRAGAGASLEQHFAWAAPPLPGVRVKAEHYVLLHFKIKFGEAKNISAVAIIVEGPTVPSLQQITTHKVWCHPLRDSKLANSGVRAITDRNRGRKRGTYKRQRDRN